MMIPDKNTLVETRHPVLRIAQAALAAVQGRARVAEFLHAAPLPEAVQLIAIGKAAASMATGACDVLGERIVRGLIVTKTGHGDAVLERRPGFQCLEAGHPQPDARSLAAGTALLTFIAAAPATAHLLFLISGGASSLVEVLPAGVTLSDLQHANAWLLGSGLDIARLNTVRKALSAIKGGRLVGHLQGRQVQVLLISDVRGDDPAVIGSGLLAADPGAPRLDELALPPWLAQMCRQSPVHRGDISAHVEMHVIARLADAKRAAGDEATTLGYSVSVHDEFIDGAANTAGQRMAQSLIHATPGVHIWGGETTVQLPPQPGRGGRNQSLALAAALELQGREDVVLLALGSDGSDGPTEDAGALVDGGTIARGELAGLDARHCLANADAGRFLEESGDLVHTGPTGTNVMDLVIGLKI
jgi:glycerate 2-kinase